MSQLKSLVLAAALLIATTAGALADVEGALKALRAGDNKEALSQFTKLSKAKNPDAEYWLGHMYVEGIGVKQDVPKGVKLMTKAADQGLVIAMRDLGQIYMRGDGVLQDYAKAFKRLQAAAHQNDAISQRLLGELYANGWGVDADPVWAYVWYDYAAKNHDKDALALRANLVQTMSTSEITQGEKLAQTIKGQIFGQDG
ncbi:MAG: tetratricopeptide repeat protein [Pseudomonadota bacterium]